MERVIEVFVELDGRSQFVGRLSSKLGITLDWLKMRSEQ